MRVNLTLIRIANVNKTIDNNIGGKREPSLTVPLLTVDVGLQTGVVTMEISVEKSQKAKTKTTT